jgi:hypothetical protein
MAANKGAKNPPAGASEGAAHEKSLPTRVVQQRTLHAQPVGDVLESLQEQAKDAMPGSIFDDAVTSEMTPLMKRMRSEVGTATISGKRRDSDLQANVAIEVRCDRDESGDAGCYHVRADGHVATGSDRGPIESDLPVSVEVNDANGCLQLDRDQMREDITSVVRSTGGALERKR